MKKLITAALAVVMVVGFAQAATIEYNFDDGNGVVDVNTFGGVVAGDYTLTSTGGTAFNPTVNPSPGTDPKARIGARKLTHGGAFMSFTATIPAGVTADLTNLAFEQGVESSGLVDITPLLRLTINVGGTDVSVNDYNNLAATSGAGFWSINEDIALTGLTGLTDTTVTFTFDFTQESAANSVNILANTMDDVVLTGTATGTPAEPAVIQSFGASSTDVLAGETVTLSWATLYEETLTIDQGIGNVFGLTSTQVVVNADTTYTLTADNAFGASTNATATVTIISTPPVINSFSADKTIITNGATVTLSWDVDDAVGLSIDQGIGDVSGLTSTQVVVNADTIFTLTATNLNGVVNETVEIVIGEVPVTLVGWENDDAVHYSDSWASVYADSGINSSTITHGTGLATGYTGGPGATSAMKYTGLASTDISEAIANDSYLAFTVSASGADTFDITSIQIADVNMNQPSTMMMELRSSVDGFASTLSSDAPTSDAAEGPHNWSVAGVTDQTSVEFRLYCYWTVNGGTGTGIHLRDDKTDLSDFPEAAGTTLTDPLVVVNGVIPSEGGAPGAPVDTLVITGPIDGGTAMVLTWTGENGKPYGVETNANLIIPDWQTFMTGLVGDGGTIAVTNTIGPNQTFYRVISE